MKYSIIVPAYNVSQYIEECIESVLNQNYDNYEVIVVDDGATDETPQIIDNLAQKSEKVRVIHQKMVDCLPHEIAELRQQAVIIYSFWMEMILV